MIDTEEIAVVIIADTRETSEAGAEAEAGKGVSKAGNTGQPDLGQVITEFRADLDRVRHIMTAGSGRAIRASQRVVKEAKTAAVITARITMAVSHIIKEAAEKAKTEAERIIGETKKGAQAPSATELLRQRSELGEFNDGKVKLEIISPVDFHSLTKFQECLGQVPELSVISVGGSATGTEITVATQTPVSVAELLEGMAVVERVAKGSQSIGVALRRSKQ